MSTSSGRSSSRAVDHEIRSLRRWGIAYAAGVLAVIVGGVVFTFHSYSQDVATQDHVNDLVAHQEHRAVTVFEVRDTYDDEYGETTALIEVDGNIVEIGNLPSYSWWEMFQGDRYEPGDQVTVVLDGDPEHAWNVKDRQDITPWSRLGALLFIWGLFTLFTKLVLWRMDWRLPIPPRALRHFIRPMVARARVTEIRDVGVIEDLLEQNPLATVVVEINERPHVWEVHFYESMELEVGMEFDVWGAPRLGGWVVGMTTPHKLYPRSPLD